MLHRLSMLAEPQLSPNVLQRHGSRQAPIPKYQRFCAPSGKSGFLHTKCNGNDRRARVHARNSVGKAPDRYQRDLDFEMLTCTQSQIPFRHTIPDQIWAIGWFSTLETRPKPVLVMHANVKNAVSVEPHEKWAPAPNLHPPAVANVLLYLSIRGHGHFHIWDVSWTGFFAESVNAPSARKNQC